MEPQLIGIVIGAMAAVAVGAIAAIGASLLIVVITRPKYDAAHIEAMSWGIAEALQKGIQQGFQQGSQMRSMDSNMDLRAEAITSQRPDWSVTPKGSEDTSGPIIDEIKLAEHETT